MLINRDLKTPEQRLWYAVMAQAFSDLYKSKRSQRAVEFFFQPNMGLEEICGAIGLPVYDIRKKAGEVFTKKDPKVRVMFRVHYNYNENESKKRGRKPKCR